MIDVPLLRKELEHITVHRDEWDQSTWLRPSRTTECGTVGCLAGNTVLHAGWLPATTNGVVDLDVASTSTQLEYVTDGRRVLSVRDVATGELGLNRWQASLLFNGQNSLPALWIMANVLTDGEVDVPPPLIEEVNQTFQRQMNYAELRQHYVNIIAETRAYYERFDDHVNDNLARLEGIED